MRSKIMTVLFLSTLTCEGTFFLCTRDAKLGSCREMFRPDSNPLGLVAQWIKRATLIPFQGLLPQKKTSSVARSWDGQCGQQQAIPKEKRISIHAHLCPQAVTPAVSTKRRPSKVFAVSGCSLSRESRSSLKRAQRDLCTRNGLARSAARAGQ